LTFLVQPSPTTSVDRLDKITKVEFALASGKTLLEEQMQQVATKAGIEKALTELEALKTHFEELAQTAKQVR
jgi:hypothetical protein